MDLLKPNLKAGTLVESLVAMVIVMLSFGIATLIFSNVTSSSSLNEKTRAELLLQEISAKTIEEKNFLDGEGIAGGIRLGKSVSPYAGAKGLSAISLSAFNQKGKKIAERNELVFTQ